MKQFENEIVKTARRLGFKSSVKHLCELGTWLREEKHIHLEVGSIWDDLHNKVESYYYTVNTPINIYYTEPVYASGGVTYNEMLLQGLTEALSILSRYLEQKHFKVTDDQVVIAYLKGYGDKNNSAARPAYRSNLEKYAYRLGKQGDYIEEGLTEDDIVQLVRNREPQLEETRRLE